MRRGTEVLLLGVIAFLFLVPGARADVVLKSGSQVNTTQTNCFSSFVTPSYSQQTAAAGNTTGIEPRVGDVFYLSLRVDFISSFDCAADFFSAQATLPNNLAPAVSGSSTSICRRWGLNSAGNQVFDSRAQSNCVASPPYSAGTHIMSMRPTNPPILPDVGGDAGGYWFTGIRYPQESQTYDSVQLLVPVKASATISNQPISFLVCTVGTNCVTATVNLTVTTGPLAADPPLVSLPGGVETSAVGARVPFTINDVAGGSYFLKVDASTAANFSGGQPCASLPSTYQTSGGVPFTGQTSSEIQFGDLQTGGITCYLSPQTLYYVKVCSVSTDGSFTELNCRYSTFTTGAVTSSMELPGTGPQPSTSLSALTRVMAGHPAGNTKVQRRFTAVGGGYVDASSNQAITQNTAGTAAVTQSVTLPTEWRKYDLRVCFVAVQTSCSTPVVHLAGAAHSDGEATSITSTSATVAGHPSTPYPAGPMSARIGTTDPGNADPLNALGFGGSTSIAADPSTAAAASTSIPLTGLTPSTTYWWAACFDNPLDAGIDDCGEVKTFTTPANPGGDADLASSKPKKLIIKIGKSGFLKVPVRNSGDADATSSKLCASVPKKVRKTVKVADCVDLGTIAPGASKTAKVKVTAKKKAKAGTVKIAVKLTWAGGARQGKSGSVKMSR